MEESDFKAGPKFMVPERHSVMDIMQPPDLQRLLAPQGTLPHLTTHARKATVGPPRH